MTIQVTVSGVEELNLKINRIKPMVQKELFGDVPFGWMRRVMVDAKELAPFEPPDIRDDIHLNEHGYIFMADGREMVDTQGSGAEGRNEVVRSKESPVSVMGFGGGAVDYALLQHEEFPTKKVPGKQWKYLETPAKNRDQELDQMISKGIDEALIRAFK